MKRLGIIILLLALWTFPGYTQTALSGKVTNEDTGEEMIGANVIAYKNGVYVTGISTDFDGKFQISIDPGQYDIEVSYVGYKTNRVTDVVIKKEQMLHLNIEISLSDYDTWCGGYFVFNPTIPLIRVEETTSGVIIEKEQIIASPVKGIKDIVLNAPGVSTFQF